MEFSTFSLFLSKNHFEQTIQTIQTTEQQVYQITQFLSTQQFRLSIAANTVSAFFGTRMNLSCTHKKGFSLENSIKHSTVEPDNIRVIKQLLYLCAHDSY